MTHEERCVANCHSPRQERWPVLSETGHTERRVRCGSNLSGSAAGQSLADGRHEWQEAASRSKQGLNLSRKVEQVAIVAGQSHRGARRIRRQIVGQYISRRSHRQSAFHRDKSVQQHQSSRTTSHNNNSAWQRNAGPPTTKRCVSAHNFNSSRARRHLIQPLIDFQSGAPLSSSSSSRSSSASLCDAPGHTPRSRTSVSSLSLIQFSRHSEMQADCEQHSSDHSRAEARNCERKERRKKSCTSHFCEHGNGQRPVWRTHLTNSDLSAYASSSDEYENDDVFETLNPTRTLDASRRCNSSGLLDEDLKLFDDLSGFGARIAKFSSTDEELIGGSRRPDPSRSTSRATRSRTVPRDARLKAARKPTAVLSHSVEISAKDLDCVKTQQMGMISCRASSQGERSEGKSMKGRQPVALVTRIRRPRFSYWPLLSWSSAFSTSISTTNRAAGSTNSAEGFDESALSEGAATGNKWRALGQERAQLDKPARRLKYFVQENLLASLIGIYILISMAVIIVLMVPYMRSLPEQPVRVSVSTQTSGGASENVAQRQDDDREEEAMIRKMTSLPGALAQPSNLLPAMAPQADEPAGQWTKNASKSEVEEVSSRKRRLDLVPKRLLVGLVKMRAEEGARESESFQELWRVVHKRPCSPLKIPFCSRSLGSMLPESATMNAQFMASLPAEHMMAYDKTLLPNQFTMGRQSQVEQVLERYDPLVDVRCYSLMPLFLCSIFAPKCLQINATVWGQSQRAGEPGRLVAPSKSKRKDAPEVKEAVEYLDRLFPASKARSGGPPAIGYNKTGGEKVQLARLVPPCRSVCREALRKCSFFLEVLSLTLFTSEDCENLPESSDEKVCVGQRENLLLQQAHANMKCRSDEFRCSNGDCIPHKWHCDGFTDCSDKSDEQRCSHCDSVSQFYCGHDVCIDKKQVCDGHIDCRDGRDERLCLRLSSSNNSSSLLSQKPQLRRLEAWNATLGQWAPVCAHHWRPAPMSHEACQALGYARANETLIHFDSPLAEQRLGRSAPMPDHSVSYAQSQQLLERRADLAGAAAAKPSQAPEVKKGGSSKSVELLGSHSSFETLASLLQVGAQSGCEPAKSAADEHILSSVYLSCQGFRCGRSVTSYLSRAQQQQQQQQLLSSSATLAASTGPSSMAIKSSAPSFARSLIDTFSLNSTAEDSSQPSDDLSIEQLRESQTESVDQYEADYSTGLASSELGGAEAPAPVSARLVVGGIESMPGEFPYLAALHGGPDEVFFCGGVLISTNWLLTAAHCVGNRTQPEGWMVKVGVTRRIASPAFVRKLKVRRIIKHESFNVGLHLNNDIALIHLAEDVEFNQYLRPICLPPAGLKLGPDSSKDCVVVGFGKSRFSQEANYLHVAHFAKVPIISQQQCALWYAEQDVKLADGMMCAGYSEGKRDACQGDSGSGLFCRHSNTNHFFVAGVVSFGIKCATPKLPGVYTSVPHYVDWINRIIGNGDSVITVE